ncbi:MAG: DUF7344 domain-containing protein [Halobacteriota archaeon]
MPARSQMDTLHEILAHQRRRDALRCLEGSEHPITVAELAEDVARYERESNLSEISNDVVRRIHLRLYHVDLAKLADVGLIEYDSRTGTIRYDGHSNVLEELLNVQEENNTR